MNNFLSQINLAKLFQTSYIFDVSPAATGLYLYSLIIFGIFILSAVASILIFKRKNKIYRKLQKGLFIFLLVIGVSGLLMTFFRFEAIPYLGSRLMFLILFLAFIFWGGWIAFYGIFTLPQEKLAQAKKQKFAKYLPRRRAEFS